MQYDSSLEKPEQFEGQGTEVTTNEQKRVGSQSESQAGNEKETLTEAEVAARPVAPACHQCGEVMVLRKARSGKNAGQQFFGG